MEWEQLVRDYVSRWTLTLREALEGGRPGASPESARALWEAAHRLQGTGASYGFPELSAVGGELQALVEPAARQGRALDGAEQARAATLIHAALEHLARHPAEPGRSRPPAARPRPAEAERPLKVAYLDDDRFMREWLRRALPPDTEYVACGSSSELKACLHRFAPDVILIDLLLERESGYDVCAELKRDPALSRVPIFLVSANGSFPDRVRAVQVGAETVLPKPFDPDELIQRVRRIQEMECEGPRGGKVAAVDDSEDALEAVRYHLTQAGFTVETTRRPMETLDLLRSFHPDLLLLDMDMPEASGIDICRAIRDEPGFETLPIVFLTARGDDESKLQGLRAGADDYLTKPFSPAELVARVTARIERVRLYRSLSIRDGLTGTFNHAYFQEQLRKEVATARRHQRPLAVALVDVDRFKRVNDRFGHRTGDQVLQALGRLLSTRLRRGDTVARYGGEEFGLLLLEVTKRDAVRVVDRLRQLFEQRAFSAVPVTELSDGGDAAGGGGRAAEPLTVTFSAGVAAYPEDGDDPEELLRRADAALYAAKRAGRNRVCPACAVRTSPGWPSRTSI